MTATIPKKWPKCSRKSARERNRRRLDQRPRNFLDRIANRPGVERGEPMITASNIHYELADRVQGLGPGGIGAMLLLSRRIGLIRDIDHNLRLLKRHSPYHESDHVLNIAFNHLAGGKHIEHIELRRNDEVYLDALGARRFPDPTTEGDFCSPFFRARRRHPDGRNQPDAAASLGTATLPASLLKRSSTLMAPWSAPTLNVRGASASLITVSGVTIPC